MTFLTTLICPQIPAVSAGSESRVCAVGAGHIELIEAFSRGRARVHLCLICALSLSRPLPPRATAPPSLSFSLSFSLTRSLARSLSLSLSILSLPPPLPRRLLNRTELVASRRVSSNRVLSRSGTVADIEGIAPRLHPNPPSDLEKVASEFLVSS